MKKAKKVTKKVQKSESEYKASVIVMGKTFSATGVTAREAIAGLKPGNVRGKSILIIEKGDVRKERILMPIMTLRLFTTVGISQEIALKNASILFDGI